MGAKRMYDAQGDEGRERGAERGGRPTGRGGEMIDQWSNDWGGPRGGVPQLAFLLHLARRLTGGHLISGQTSSPAVKHLLRRLKPGGGRCSSAPLAHLLRESSGPHVRSSAGGGCRAGPRPLGGPSCDDSDVFEPATRICVNCTADAQNLTELKYQRKHIRPVVEYQAERSNIKLANLQHMSAQHPPEESLNRR